VLRERGVLDPTALAQAPRALAHAHLQSAHP
jgi:hypothetical protein